SVFLCDLCVEKIFIDIWGLACNLQFERQTSSGISITNHKPAPNAKPDKPKYRRMFKSVLFTGFMLLFSLGLGVLGYHELAQLSWIDSFLMLQ
ncbi:MAG TPA: hypothetical protein VGP47_10765, partial [Parachlamydiaceae bacterium]|nr:hypothetical protein [Parachlamydiaceae bacterium]